MSAPEGNAPIEQNTAPVQGAGDGQGDALDKGLDTLAGKLGFGGQSHSNIEKASDGIRGLFKKATGKDIPIKDQDYK